MIVRVNIQPIWKVINIYWSSDQKLQKQIEFLEENNEYVATYHKVQSFDVINGKKRE